MENKPKGLEGYAAWLIESTRIQLGYDAKDPTHDDEVEKHLKSGSKISKSRNQQNKIAVVKKILEDPDWKERNGMHWWEVKVEIEIDGIPSNYTMEMDTGDSARAVTIGYEFEIKKRS